MLNNRDAEIFLRLQEHYKEALEYFPKNRIVGIFLQGSQNYGMEVPGSDVDTKLIVVPTFEEIAFNRKPHSNTHIRENNEHIDFKDIRLMLETFRKQNLNFLEILFTPYKLINPMYEEEWNKLVERAEEIAHYNRFLAVKAMKGVAMEKYHALEHPYPAKLEVLAKYGYDPKQLHHLLRIEEYLERYIAGDSYQSCLSPVNRQYLVKVKQGLYSKEDAEVEAERALAHVVEMSDAIQKNGEWDKCDENVDALLDEVQLNIMKIAMRSEL